jgi:midasin (ATPase involved in ribosome maturation)
VEKFGADDLLFIASAMYPSIPRDVLSLMIRFNSQIHHDTMVRSTVRRK